MAVVIQERDRRGIESLLRRLAKHKFTFGMKDEFYLRTRFKEGLEYGKYLIMTVEVDAEWLRMGYGNRYEQEMECAINNAGYEPFTFEMREWHLQLFGKRRLKLRFRYKILVRRNS